MKQIQSFMSTTIFDAKLYASFFLIYHLMKTFTAVKINESMKSLKGLKDKVHYVILNG